MNKVAQLLLVAVAAGAGGGALVWLKVKPAPPQPIIVEVHSAPGQIVKTTEATRTRIREVAREISPPTPRPFRGATPDTVAGTVPVSGDAEAKREPRSDERDDGPPPERVVVNQMSINQATVNRIVVAPPPAAPLEKPGQPAPVTVALGTIDDALSYALEAAEPYVKEGFTIREDYWGGDLPAKGTKAIVHQLFKGNEYWFWMGTNVKDARISVHVYDSEGNLAEVEAKPLKVTGGGSAFAARVAPKRTASYYLIVEVGSSGPPSSLQETARVPWALAYGFR